MAGQRHHILPRFLLKGFASRTDGQKAFTWVYRKEGDPFEASTRDVGVEKHFYGKAGETDVDGRITAIETQYANLVDDLRTRKAGEVSHLPVAELVTHLWVRTKHLPDSLRLSSEFLFAAMWEY